jgi:ABC-2 type transport system ATP-binding protein
VHVAGELMSSDASHLRGRIGFLTEAPGLWDRLTVYDNLMTYARLQGVTAERQAVRTALDLFGIADRAHDRAAQLSKGLKQRVALARTLIHNPPVVLLDEPTAGLDPESAHETRALILRLRSEQRTVVISTHNLDEVDRVADRVAVLRTRLIAVGTPAALRARLFGTRLTISLAAPAAQYERTVQAAGGRHLRIEGHTISLALDGDAAATPRIVRALVEAGADVLSVVPDEPTLEEVYLRLVREEPR